MRKYIIGLVLGSYLALSGCNRNERPIDNNRGDRTLTNGLYSQEIREEIDENRRKLFDILLDPNASEGARRHADVLIRDSIQVERDLKRLDSMPYLKPK